MYDSYVDLHVSVIFAVPRVVMVYPSILSHGRWWPRGGRDGSGGADTHVDEERKYDDDDDTRQ